MIVKLDRHVTYNRELALLKGERSRPQGIQHGMAHYAENSLQTCATCLYTGASTPPETPGMEYLMSPKVCHSCFHYCKYRAKCAYSLT